MAMSAAESRSRREKSARRSKEHTRDTAKRIVEVEWSARSETETKPDHGDADADVNVMGRSGNLERLGWGYFGPKLGGRKEGAELVERAGIGRDWLRRGGSGWLVGGMSIKSRSDQPALTSPSGQASAEVAASLFELITKSRGQKHDDGSTTDGLNGNIRAAPVGGK